MTSVARRQEQDDSGEYSDGSQDIDQNNSENDAGQRESDYDSEGSDSERSERDPDSSQETERRVDDDEDRSNPQYIPKRGTFYEHDDRTAASGEDLCNTTSETTSDKKEGTEAPAERRRPPRKSEIINKWSHDKYNENEQAPKTREELVAIYGYDIRNEEAPPHARRNRRYGRGPNKYTRTWEDEEAYRRQTAIQAQNRKPLNPEDFPELDATAKRQSKRGRVRPRSKSQPASNDSSENGSELRRNASIKTTNKPKMTAKQNAPNRSVSMRTASRPHVKDKLPALENLTITATVYNNNTHGPTQRKVNASVAQQRPVPTEQGRKKTVSQPQIPHQNNSVQNKPHSQQISTNNQKPQQLNQIPQQPQTANTAGVEGRGGSKRYSSIRQRPLAESYVPQPVQAQPQTQPQQQQQPHRFHNAEYTAAAPPPQQHQGSPVPQIHPQQLMHQVHHSTVNQSQHGPSPPHQQLSQQLPQQLPQQLTQQLSQQLPQQHHTQQVRLGMLEQQQLVSHAHHAIHNMPPQPHAMGPLQASQGYTPPTMMPAQYMQQTGNAPVYGGAVYAPAAPPAPYAHQLYQHHNYATQAGGVTYYSALEQEQAPRAQRRRTAAIPIVCPAPAAPAADRPANSSEKDNIDRIVENMFVRKPWTPQDAAKDKSQETRNSQEPQSKESSQSNSLVSSTISTHSRVSENKDEKPEEPEVVTEIQETPEVSQDTIEANA